MGQREVGLSNKSYTNQLISTFIFTAEWGDIGWKNDGGTATINDLFLTAYIPKGTVITNAVMYVDNCSRYVVGGASFGIPNGYYNASNIKLFYNKGTSNIYYFYPYASTPAIIANTAVESTSFGTWNPPASTTIQKNSADVTNLISVDERITFKLTGGATTPTATSAYTDGSLARMQLVVTGYRRR